MQDAPAVYFVRPTAENVKRIAEDCAKQVRTDSKCASTYVRVSSSFMSINVCVCIVWCIRMCVNRLCEHGTFYALEASINGRTRQYSTVHDRTVYDRSPQNSAVYGRSPQNSAVYDRSPQNSAVQGRTHIKH